MKKLMLLAIIAIMMILSGCAANMEQEPQTPTNNLINAAKAGDKAKVEQLIKEGVDVNASNSDGYTPLYIAAYNNHKEIVKLLIANNADVNAPGYKGNTPLSAAAYMGNRDVARLLVAHGADPNVPSHHGYVHWEKALSEAQEEREQQAAKEAAAERERQVQEVNNNHAWRKCGVCNGTGKGKGFDYDRCSVCGGTGQIQMW